MYLRVNYPTLLLHYLITCFGDSGEIPLNISHCQCWISNLVPFHLSENKMILVIFLLLHDLYNENYKATYYRVNIVLFEKYLSFRRWKGGGCWCFSLFFLFFCYPDLLFLGFNFQIKAFSCSFSRVSFELSDFLSILFSSLIPQATA